MEHDAAKFSHSMHCCCYQVAAEHIARTLHRPNKSNDTEHLKCKSYGEWSTDKKCLFTTCYWAHCESNTHARTLDDDFVSWHSLAQLNRFNATHAQWDRIKQLKLYSTPNEFSTMELVTIKRHVRVFHLTFSHEEMMDTFPFRSIHSFHSMKSASIDHNET